MKQKAIGASLALVAALVCGVAAGVIYQKRDLIFEWSFAKPHGKFDEHVSEVLVSSALNFLEEKNPGRACAIKPVGHDDSFLYAGTGCAKFPGEGDDNFVPTRLSFSGDRVKSAERPNPEAFQNSMHRLFPVVAFEKMRYGFSATEFQRVGLERWLVKEHGR